MNKMNQDQYGSFVGKSILIICSLLIHTELY